MPDGWTSWLAFAGSALTVLGGMAALFRWLRPLVHGLGDFLDDWRGLPARPGVARRPGVLERLSHLETALDDHIKAHVTGAAVDLRRRRGRS